MPTLEIGNSYSRITGMTAQEEKLLRNTLSYTVGGSAAYFSGYGVRKKSLVNKRGEFPTGLLHRLPLKPTAVIDTRFKTTYRLNSAVFPATPYPWQVKAVETAIAAERGVISAPTGTGKSLAMALLIHRLGLRTLVVVPSLEIAKQLHETFKILGITRTAVHNIDSAALKTYRPYDCLIIDEAHHSAAKTYQKLNKTMWSNIYYRFFFTATPFRNDPEESLLFEGIAGDVVYKLTYKEALKEKLIVPVEAYYVEMPRVQTDAYTWNEVYKELVVNNEYRNETLCLLLHTLGGQGKNVLCLVKEVGHGKNIGWPYFVHGEDDESRGLISDFNAGKVKALIGTEGIIGEGVDTKPCEYVILAGLGKAKSRIMQAVGRGVRRYANKESCKVVLIKDKSHKYLLRHFKEQCKILKEEYGVIPMKLEIK